MERNLEREKIDSKTLNFIKNFQNVLNKLWHFQFDLVGSKKYKYRQKIFKLRKKVFVVSNSNNNIRFNTLKMRNRKKKERQQVGQNKNTDTNKMQTNVQKNHGKRLVKNVQVAVGLGRNKNSHLEPALKQVCMYIIYN